jgi:hypothetical protein
MGPDDAYVLQLYEKNALDLSTKFLKILDKTNNYSYPTVRYKEGAFSLVDVESDYMFEANGSHQWPWPGNVIAVNDWAAIKQS